MFIRENECVLLVSEEEPVEEDEVEQQSFQPTAKVGAKKQRKLEEKQAKKAQREVRHMLHCPLRAHFHLLVFNELCSTAESLYSLLFSG